MTSAGPFRAIRLCVVALLLGTLGAGAAPAEEEGAGAMEAAKRSEAGAGAADSDTGVDQAAIVAAYRASQSALDEGEIETAIEQGERALALATKGLGAEHKTTGILAFNLASVYEARERWGDARRSYEAALVGYEATHGRDSPALLPVLEGLGESLGRLEAYEESQAVLERALALGEAQHGEESDEVAVLLQKLGIVAQQRGDADDAMSYGKRALRIFKETRGEEDVQVGLIYFGLGTLAAQTGDIEDAQRNIDRGEDILSEALPAGHPYLIGLYDFLAETYSQVGQTSKARRYRRKAEEHREAASSDEG